MRRSSPASTHPLRDRSKSRPREDMRCTRTREGESVQSVSSHAKRTNSDGLSANPRLRPFWANCGCQIGPNPRPRDHVSGGVALTDSRHLQTKKPACERPALRLRRLSVTATTRRRFGRLSRSFRPRRCAAGTALPHRRPRPHTRRDRCDVPCRCPRFPVRPAPA